MYVCALCARSTQRDQKMESDPMDRSYSFTKWVLGVELKPSAGAASPLSICAMSPTASPCL